MTASSVVRDLTVLADRVAPDATVDDQRLCLPPGESRTVVVTTSTPVRPEDFLHPEVLRSANDLAAPPRR